MNTADRTPRASVSTASSSTKPPSSRSRNGKQKAKDTDADMGDDEYEDEDDAARQKARSKMRAIDDGSRRPSLPTNIYIPDNSSPSPVSPSPQQNKEREQQQLSPAVGSERGDSAPDDSEPDGDEGDLDTDVEFDLQQHGHSPHLDGLLPNSQARMKSSGNDLQRPRFRRRRSLDRDRNNARQGRDGNESAADDNDDTREVSVSPVTFSRNGYDSAGEEGPEVDTFYVAPNDQQQRRQSKRRSEPVPWDSPFAVSGPNSTTSEATPRDREDSMATITAARASLGTPAPHAMTSMDVFAGGSSGNPEELQHQDQQMVESPQRLEQEQLMQMQQQQQHQSENDVYDGFNMDYILSGPPGSGSSVRRSSWAPSYIQAPPSNNNNNSPSFWNHMTGPDAYGRRPSTMTVGTSSGEDIFTKHLRLFDEGYDERRAAWSFRMDGVDVSVNGRRSSAANAGLSGHGHGHGQGQVHEKVDPRKPMEPNTREIWRQAYVGMFKVDRQRVECMFCLSLSVWLS